MMILLYLIILIIINISFLFILSKVAESLKLVDVPNERKIHKGNVPIVGGIAIYLSLFLLIPFLNQSHWINLIIYSASTIVILGALDDALQIGIVVRLFAQIIAASLILGGGLSILDLGEYNYIGSIKIGMFGIFFTLFTVLATVNAFNFIDGIDGLASSLVLIALGSLYIFGILDGGITDKKIFYLLFINILVFFLVNLGLTPLKKIFLGDAGSMMLGFITAWLLIYYSHPTVKSIHPVLTLWCITIPAYDFLGVIIRRIIKNKNIFIPDRMHLHHVLLNKGYSPKYSLILISVSACFLSLFGGITYFIFGAFISLITYFILFCLYILGSYFYITKFK